MAGKRGRPARGRGRGRPPSRKPGKQRAVQESVVDDDEEVLLDDGSASEMDESTDSASNHMEKKKQKAEEEKAKVANVVEGGKKRGRKRKADMLSIERNDPEVDLTRKERDVRRTVRTTTRYSPPPVITRGRGARASTSSTISHASVNEREEGEDEMADSTNGSNTSVGRLALTYTKRGRGRPSAASIAARAAAVRPTETETVTTALEVVKSADNQSYVVKMPDGGAVTVPVPKRTTMAEDDDDDEDGPSKRRQARAMANDPEYVPEIMSNSSDPTLLNEPAPIQRTPTISSANSSARPASKLSGMVKFSNQVTNSIAITTSSTGTLKMLGSNSKTVTRPAGTPIISSSNPVANATMAFARATAAASVPPRRTVNLSKYLESLPEIKDCVYPDGISDENMEKLPDKILLVHSELPLKLAVGVEFDDRPFLFRQIIAPQGTNRFVCLLCKGIDVNFCSKDEKDMLLHYQSLHELEVEVGNAKFSDDIVFICLPKMILAQFNSQDPVEMNSPCQYCEEKLGDVKHMRAHYAEAHQKEVVMMEQEEILKMHHYYYCSLCKHQSPDFDTHQRHMKLEHRYKSYRCKSCVLVTQDEQRLRTHYKAKHMLHSQGQNLQCYYCHGLLIGVERLQKHVQQSHMVNTGSAPTAAGADGARQNEFSCIACLQVAGSGKLLLDHASACQLAGKLPLKSELRFVPHPPVAPEELAPGEQVCMFCNVRLEDEDALQLHLHHEHMQWVLPDNDVNSSAVSVVTGDETSENDKKGATFKIMKVDEAISNEDMARAKINTYVGHWCLLCDQMIKVYQLFYLHMFNFHKMVKRFVCVITSCRKQFDNLEDLKAHIENEQHSQKTIITHPDEVFVCTYCDLYFESDEALINHLITDQHINKFTSSGHFHRTEPRNFKCKACHTFFGMKESYTHHLETESHKYECSYCGISTATACARRAHTTNTHPEKLTVCEECGDTIEDPLAHYVVHGYSFECMKCVKKFYNREKLNAHMEVHQDPIECNWHDPRTEKFCGRMIATRSMMVTHYRSHKSDHKCNICGQSFWNFSMLSSHYRSHQAFRSPAQLPPKVVQRPMLSNQQRTPGTSTSDNMPTVVKRAPVLSNSVVKCGQCGSIFKTNKELVGHRCTPMTMSKVVGGSIVPSTSSNKLLDLAKASAAAKASGSRARPRRPSPKKNAMNVHLLNEQQEAAQQLIDVTGLGGDEQDGDSNDPDTQVIMILNQTTGELMEITAPKGMQVSDVINSLNLNEGIDGQVDATQQVVEGEVEEEEMVIDSTSHEQQVTIGDLEQEVTTETAVNLQEQEGLITSTLEQEPFAQVSEIIVHENDQGHQQQILIEATTSSACETVVTTSAPMDSVVVDGSQMINNEPIVIKQEEEEESRETTQFIIEDGQGNEQRIVLPSECFNDDGTLTLDDETMARFAIQISADGHIVSTDPTTFVTSATEQ